MKQQDNELSKKMVGQRYGKLEVVNVFYDGEKYKANCICHCSDGRKIENVIKDAYSVRKGRAKECDLCMKERPPKYPKSEKMIGNTYGILTVIGIAPTFIDSKGISRPQVYATCACDPLAPAKQYEAYCLRSGDISSCGCIQAEARRSSNFKHGYSNDKLYARLASIKNRCTNPNSSSWHRYGGRPESKGGPVLLYEEWYDLEKFYEYMVKTYPNYKELMEEGKHIDKDTNGGHYMPGMLKWASRKENACKTSTNRNITVFGETLALSAAIRKYGVNELCKDSLTGRLNTGWDVHRALMYPSIKGRKKERCYPDYNIPPTEQEKKEYLERLAKNGKIKNHTTKHSQVLVAGILIDRGLELILPKIWKLGYQTTQSCQNHIGTNMIWIEFIDEDTCKLFIKSVLIDLAADYKRSGKSIYIDIKAKSELSVELTKQVNKLGE